MEKVIKDYGKVNIMVTVAGTAGNRQPAETFDIDEWQKVMNVNVRGTMLCAKYAGAEYIKQGGGGKVITIGSVRGFLGHPGGYAAYGTSKGAVHLLTKQLATEWAKHQHQRQRHRSLHLLDPAHAAGARQPGDGQDLHGAHPHGPGRRVGRLHRRRRVPVLSGL